MAIDEFRALEERHATLSAQQKDLVDAMASLRETIKRINRSSRELFLTAFETIRGHYVETFKVLFNGGRADLVLEEGDDVLECGIEMIAQPPGKRDSRQVRMWSGFTASSEVQIMLAHSALVSRFTRRAAKAKDMESKVAFLQRAAEADPSNDSTAYALGETLRLWSWQGNPGYERLATDAMHWFELGMKVNPLDPYNFARYGMCLHWLNQHDKAAPYFEQAFARDLGRRKKDRPVAHAASRGEYQPEGCVNLTPAFFIAAGF
jgi:tetratricopeptide (TPR) repeat protein